MKLKDVVLNCGGGNVEGMPDRIFIKAVNGKWNGHVNQYSMYERADRHDEYRTLEAAQSTMHPQDVLIEYVAVARYRCKVETA